MRGDIISRTRAARITAALWQQSVNDWLTMHRMFSRHAAAR